MSEPINSAFAARNNIEPLRIELPPNPVTAQMVQHHMAGEDGSLVRTGKIEVRIVNPVTKKDAKRTVDWHATAMNCAHQTAYYKQVYDNVVMKAEELERKYSASHQNSEAYRRDLMKLNPVINAAFALKIWWGWFLLPKNFKRLISTVER